MQVHPFFPDITKLLGGRRKEVELYWKTHMTWHIHDNGKFPSTQRKNDNERKSGKKLPIKKDFFFKLTGPKSFSINFPL